jgi:hypothetical protein
MDNAGVVGGNEVFKDRETGSRWQQSSLEAISGPLKGEHLELYPFLLTSWEEWRRLHPDTLVLKPLPGYAERIPAKNAQLRAGFPLSKPAPDDVRAPRRSAQGLHQGHRADRRRCEPRLSPRRARSRSRRQRGTRRPADSRRAPAEVGDHDGVHRAREREAPDIPEANPTQRS